MSLVRGCPKFENGVLVRGVLCVGVCVSISPIDLTIGGIPMKQLFTIISILALLLGLYYIACI